MSTHRDLMVDLARQYDWRRGAELGLGTGHLFTRLLRECQGLFLIGVDHFRRADRKAAVEATAKLFSDRCIVYGCTTNEAAPKVPDGSLDFVFVDAGHGYEAVRDDIARWLPKVRPGGWFGGHDYHPDHPGVIRAVNEALAHRILLDHSVWWVTV